MLHRRSDSEPEAMLGAYVSPGWLIFGRLGAMLAPKSLPKHSRGLLGSILGLLGLMSGLLGLSWDSFWLHTSQSRNSSG